MHWLWNSSFWGKHPGSHGIKLKTRSPTLSHDSSIFARAPSIVAVETHDALRRYWIKDESAADAHPAIQFLNYRNLRILYKEYGDTTDYTKQDQWPWKKISSSLNFHERSWSNLRECSSLHAKLLFLSRMEISSDRLQNILSLKSRSIEYIEERYFCRIYNWRIKLGRI